MAHIARIVIPEVPHHVTQRGNRRQTTFFCDADYELYLDLMAESCRKHRVEVWCYCLMPNHPHLIAVPETEDGLRNAMGEAHQKYTTTINEREGWKGILWQGRFFSCPMDTRHLLAAARYIECNPVEAGMVAKAEDYRWSSARAHLARKDDRLVKTGPLLEMVPDWQEFLRSYVPNGIKEQLELHGRTGRPLGDQYFISDLERRTGRRLFPRPPGRKPRGE